MSKYPTIKNVVTGSFNTAQSNFTINLPVGVEPGDMVVIFYATPQTWEILPTTATGVWQRFSLQTSNGVYHNSCIFKTNNGETSVDLEITQPVSVILTYHIYVLSASRNFFYNAVGGFQGNPAPIPINVTLGDYLVINTTVKNIYKDTQPIPSELPTDFSDGISSVAFQGGTSVTLASAISLKHTSYLLDPNTNFTFFENDFIDAFIVIGKNNKLTIGVINDTYLHINGDITKDNLEIKN